MVDLSRKPKVKTAVCKFKCIINNLNNFRKYAPNYYIFSRQINVPKRELCYILLSASVLCILKSTKAQTNACSVTWFEVHLGSLVPYGVYWPSINNIGSTTNYITNSAVRDTTLRHLGLFLSKLWNINWFVTTEIKTNVRYIPLNVQIAL